ncbi:MAG: amino acid adenylation domain-containing protein [Oscillospiraceae bacterium]|nr:amino acid adenylation domain-containing protein [Oscillospiraceae bacterium]
MGCFALTGPQRNIFDLEQFSGGALSVTISGFALWSGAPDESALQRALNLLLQTNDALRLRLAPQGQYVAPYAEEAFPVRRFGSLEELRAWAAAQAREPMDPAGPLYRLAVVAVESPREKSAGLFAQLHHMISDAWSLARLADLFHTYYHNPQPEECPSYRLFAEKEAQYLQSERRARDKAFWLEQFAQPPEPCLLARKPASSLAVARCETLLSPQEAQPLREFAAREGLSLYNLLITALAAYLYRLRGQTDLCVGTTTLGRSNAAMKKTVGMFAGTAPVPIHLAPNASLPQNARALKGILLGLLRHDGFGYPDLLAQLKQQSGFSGRFYDVLFTYVNAVMPNMGENLEGIWTYPCNVQAETLQINVSDRAGNGSMLFLYDYHTESLTEREVEQIHKRLLTLLRDALAHPDRSLDQLELLCEEDQAAWDQLNQTDHDVTIRPVHKFFEDQAAANPRRPAVMFHEERLTYGELNAWANRIAALLRENNIVPGSVVAVRMERCLELLPTLLGIMKAGACYLPLLPEWPEARVKFVLEDARAALLLCQPGCEAKEFHCITTEQLHNLPCGSAASSDDPSLLAYVMYTSGSTGQPKGVCVGQDSLCNRLLWMDAAYPLSPDETLIQKTSYAFDVSAWELFWPLMQGRALLLPEPGAQRDPRRLARLIRRHGIETIHFVPSMLILFLEEIAASKTKLPSLRRIIVSGEALTPALNRRFHEIFPHAKTRLINLYGPTECTVDVLSYDCKPGDDEIPVGKPVWNTGCYVLGAGGALLPPGEVGELCVTGVQLARGYANPALNDGRFEWHPRLGRIYRTGDLCRLRGDGQILYHGRNDSQIKIRGQRVELGEIERQLEQAPGVIQAAALFENERLQAFCVANENYDEAAALQYLRTQVPAYMIPDRLFRLAELPLGANGKLDRKQLKGKRETGGGKRKIAPPESETERQIIAAVRAQLGGEDVSLSEAPSRCGLSSLDIVSVTIALEAHGLRLGVSDFYAAEDFRALALQAKTPEQLPLLVKLPGGSPPAPSSVACIGIPYGGGSFSAWADVARELPIPVYAAQTGHVEPERLLEEIRALPQRTFIVMGSCVGAGLAVVLSQRLEAEGCLAGLVIAASAPPPLAQLYGRWYNPWLLRGPRQTNRALQRLSGRNIYLGSREIANLRADAAFFLRWLARRRHVSVQAPIRLVYSSADPMLRRIRVRRRWERLFGKPLSETVIPGGMHDIVHTHAKEAAAAVMATLENNA